MKTSTLAAFVYAIVYATVLVVGTVYFVNHIWPTLPSFFKMIGFILLAFFSLAPPYALLVRQSNKITKAITEKPNETAPDPSDSKD